VLSTSDIALTDGAKTARAVTIQLPSTDNSQEVVLVGPVWYMENQKPVYQVGDTVTIEACRTTVNGHRYWIAKAVAGKEARMVLLDEGNKPVWAKP
jgi:hypothetical protein